MVVLFENDFESGDFSAWNHTKGLPAVQSVLSHHGKYAAVFNAVEDCYDTSIGDRAELYMRFYGRLDTVPAVGQEAWFASLAESITGKGVFVVAQDIGGGPIFRLAAYQTTGWTLTSTAVAVVVDTWFSFEIYWKQYSPNGARLYINGVLVATTPGTTDNVPVNAVEGGISALVGGYAVNIFEDCFKVSTEYIGPEPVNMPIVYPTVFEEQQTTVGAGATDESARVRTLRHTTVLSPWVG